MTKLHDLCQQYGQSPWIDNLKRAYLKTGQLAQLRDEGIRGVTSNPTIFQKAIEGSSDYDEEFRELAKHRTVEAAYWEMVIADVTNALAVMRPIYDAAGGKDGFVSIEVAPSLAHDTEGTIASARDLHSRIDLPNLFVKIPATAEGIPAIRQMTSEGRNINITLIFSLARYAQVMEAYLSGLEAYAAAGGDVAGVHSVASFFVSRVDTLVDRRLEAIGSSAALALRGKAALAQAQVAYQRFLSTFTGPGWEALAAKGAHLQRPLWASTSTKNTAYSDLLYIDNLIGPHTVNTMPDATLDAFLDHGTLARTVDAHPDEAEGVLTSLAGIGVDMDGVGRVLEDEGVAAFDKSFDELLQSLQDKAAALHASST
jgi:transaldolase